MRIVRPAALFLTVQGGLAGCGTTSPHTVSTKYELDPAKMHAVAYDGRGRGAYILRKGDGHTILCAEPAPDAVASTSSSRSTSVGLDSSLAYAAIAASLGLDVGDTATTAAVIADVANRTELVLILREALYRTCEAGLNGVLEPEEMKRTFETILRTTRALGRRDTTHALATALKATSNPELQTQIVEAIVAISLAETGAISDDEVARKLLFQKAVQELELPKKPNEPPPLRR